MRFHKPSKGKNKNFRKSEVTLKLTLDLSSAIVNAKRKQPSQSSRGKGWLVVFPGNSLNQQLTKIEK